VGKMLLWLTRSRRMILRSMLKRRSRGRRLLLFGMILRM